MHCFNLLASALKLSTYFSWHTILTSGLHVWAGNLQETCTARTGTVCSAPGSPPVQAAAMPRQGHRPERQTCNTSYETTLAQAASGTNAANAKLAAFSSYALALQICSLAPLWQRRRRCERTPPGCQTEADTSSHSPAAPLTPATGLTVYLKNNGEQVTMHLARKRLGSGQKHRIGNALALHGDNAEGEACQCRLHTDSARPRLRHSCTQTVTERKHKPGKM